MEEKLKEWEKLEEESFFLWEGEIARKQQDIWMVWENRLRNRMQEVAEEWRQQCVTEQKRIEDTLFLEWKGEAAQNYQKKMEQVFGKEQKIAEKLQEIVGKIGDSVQKK